MKLLTRLIPLAAFLPMFAFAQTVQLGYFTNLLSQAQTIITNILLPLIFAAALLVFLWGVFNFFVWGGGNEDKREEGKKFMLYGLIGLAVMVAVWGIVNLLISILGVNPNQNVVIPRVPGQ